MNGRGMGFGCKSRATIAGRISFFICPFSTPLRVRYSMRVNVFNRRERKERKGVSLLR